MNPENENIDFIESLVDQSINQVVRESDNVKGTFNIKVRSDGEYDITVYDGTESKARVIESVSKDELLKLIEDNV